MQFGALDVMMSLVTKYKKRHNELNYYESQKQRLEAGTAIKLFLTLECSLCFKHAA